MYSHFEKGGIRTQDFPHRENSPEPMDQAQLVVKLKLLQFNNFTKRYNALNQGVKISGITPRTGALSSAV